MKVVLFYFLLFLIYSMMGWIIEMFTVNIIFKQKFSDRGFLIGPYCPIYGFASIIMIILLSRYKNDVLVLFVMSVFICTIIEYFTSYIMEKLFKARWWDYSNEPFNLNGRICLMNCIGFGILGVLLVRFINPFFMKIILMANSNVLNVISGILFILFVSDVVFSFNIIKKIKVSVTRLNKDSTSEISKAIKYELLSKNIFIRRIINAFPDLNFIFGKKR